MARHAARNPAIYDPNVSQLATDAEQAGTDTTEEINPRTGKPKRPAKSDDEKRRSFRKFASVRVSNIVNNLENLGELAGNPKQYLYDDDQRAAIFDAIDVALQKVRDKFSSPAETGTAKKPRSFQL